MKQIIIVIVLFWITISFSVAQIGYNEKEYFLNGKEDYKEEKYRSALYYFEEIKAKNTSNQDAKYYAALCKLHLHLQEVALDELKTIDKSKLKNDTHYFYWLAEAYFLNEQFGNALEMLKIYADQNQKNRIPTYDKLLSHLRTALELYQNPENYIVRNLGQHVNSPFHDFGVSKIPSSENLIYSSNRLSFKDKITDRYDTEILTLYNAKIENDGTIKEIEEWNKSESLDSQFSVLQILKYEFTSSDKKFLISQNGELKILERKKGIWQTPQLFSQKLSNEKGIQEYAYLSKDQKILVFASDYKSKGNYELFVTTRKNKESDFDEPKILSNINSESNEITPFLDRNNTLYFSSNRENSAGGYDIFKAEYDTVSKLWKKPILLPYPINSVSDDLYFSISELNNEMIDLGYFVSNRIGGQGGDDIYTVFFFDSVQVKGQFRERTLKNSPLQNANLVFKSTNYATDSTIFQTTTDKEGNYTLNIPIHLKDKNKRYASYETVFDMEIRYEGKLAYQDQISLNAYQLAKKNDRSYTINGYLYVEDNNEKNQSINQKLLQKLLNNTSKSIVLKNIYFEQGNAKIKSESYSELQDMATFLLQNETLSLEIIGHTDNVGTAAGNLTLSKQRAQSVVDFLVEKGIDKNRLKANGYGQERPIASNDDEKEGRELNRRIEVRVID